MEPPEVEEDIKMLSRSHSIQPRVEFDIVGELGQGAYGRVLKVKNKLDQRLAALKLIKLDPYDNPRNKAMVTEVKLLSSLRHVNVVGYYHSWISNEFAEHYLCLSSSLMGTSISAPAQVLNSEDNSDESYYEDDSNGEPDDDFNMGRDSVAVTDFDDTDENESDAEYSPKVEKQDKKVDMPGIIVTNSSSDSIVFERTDKNGAQESNSQDGNEEGAVSLKFCGKQSDENGNGDAAESKNEIVYMNILMELCENSTLKQAIDADLYMDKPRVWRLFREIVDGLVYIHRQGVIHRDLKPVNIFLDSNDCVKIGDFGLATEIFLSSPGDASTSGKPGDKRDKSLRGYKIGTALYAAPELSNNKGVRYNQKVDMYSLGVIFFEMCYKLDTASERIKVLLDLRSDKIKFPVNFEKVVSQKQISIIRRLLEHDVDKRPTSEEVLQSKDLPLPALEDGTLRDLTGYRKHILNFWFKTATESVDISEKEFLISRKMKNLHQFNEIKEHIIKVYKNHGGQDLLMPQLMCNAEHQGINIITRSACTASLPRDLRLPFVQYVAYNDIKAIRRYSVDRVYRDQSHTEVDSFGPKEIYECAFDIVTPTREKSKPDSEVLLMLYEVINEFPQLKTKSIYIRLNYPLLLRAFLVYYDIENLYTEFCDLLSLPGDRLVRLQRMRQFFNNKQLYDKPAFAIFKILETELSFKEFDKRYSFITKTGSGRALKLMKQALYHLRKIVSNNQLKIGVVIYPGLVYNISQYSGMMCQLVIKSNDNYKQSVHILASGGRYNFKNVLQKASTYTNSNKQSGVGISISLDKLVMAVGEYHGRAEKPQNPGPKKSVTGTRANYKQERYEEKTVLKGKQEMVVKNGICIVRYLFIVTIQFLNTSLLSRYERIGWRNEIKIQMWKFFEQLKGSIYVLVVDLESNSVQIIKDYKLQLLSDETETSLLKTELLSKLFEIVGKKITFNKQYFADVCTEINMVKMTHYGHKIILYSTIDSKFEIVFSPPSLM